MAGNLVPYRRKYLDNLKSDYGGNYSGKPRAYRPSKPPRTGPRTVVNPKPKPLSLLELARRDVIPAYKPQRDLIQKLMDREDMNSAQRAAFMQQVYANFARFMQGIAPQIQAIYQNAGHDIAGYARGAQQGLQLQEDASAAGMQNALARAGAPAGQAPHDYGVAERLYDLTGYLPAASIAGQGAAFSAYAAGLPGIYAQKGIQDIATELAAGGKRKTELQDDLLKIKAQQAADTLKQLGILRTTRSTRQENARRLAEQKRQFDAELNFRKAVARAENLYNKGKLDLSIKQLDQAIAYQQAQLEISRRNSDTSAANAATSRLKALQAQKRAAVTAARLKQEQLLREAARRSKQTQTIWRVVGGRLVNTGKPVKNPPSKGGGTTKTYPGLDKDNDPSTPG